MRRTLVGRFLAVLSAWLCLAAGQAQAEQFSGKVVGVIDGDTIDVMREGRAVRVRLNGIDCPEKGQAFGTRAKQLASSLVFGKIVTVKVSGEDRYARILGEVLLDSGKKLNEELVWAGLAWWYKEYSDDASLGMLEAGARAAKRGLWADESPVPPWEWRREGRLLEAERKKTIPVPKESRRRESRPEAEEVQETTVYITRTGTKYHKAGCRYLRSSMIPVSLRDARARGCSPCSVCRPEGQETRGSTRPSAPEKSSRESRPTVQQDQGVAVYGTRTGSKYHRAGCRYLRKSRIAISLKDAKARYAPCSVCGPPR